MKHSRDNRPNAAPVVTAPHAVTADDVVGALGTAINTGLTSAEAKQRQAAYGANKLTARKRASLVRLLLHQFESAVVVLLALAAAIALAFGEWKEGIAVVLVLLINAVIGFTTELRAARSMEALRRLGSLTTRLRRDGRAVLVPADALVPGDVVLLEGGDVVTADLRLVEASNLSADESTLTGESLAVDKDVAVVRADSLIGDRTSMLFKGTSVTRGSGGGVVVATGMRSELGQISKLVQEAKPEQSPLEHQLQRLSGQLIKFTLGVVAVLGVLGALQGEDPFLMIKASIALAVAAIPEGLPVVATMALARGMWRMAKNNALIERLSAVETLGATTVIFTDKTGTLTENRMVLQKIDCPGGRFSLSEATGRFTAADADGAPVAQPCLDDILTAVVLCNNAELGDGDGEGQGENDDSKNTGDPLEQALLIAALAAGKTRSACLQKFPELHEIAFESATKMMATVHRVDDQNVMFVKGAPEAVLAACSGVSPANGGPDASVMSVADRAAWQARTVELASSGMRVLAVAKRQGVDPGAAEYRNLTFLGLLGLFDPPRADVAPAIAQCRSAGIRVIMMTGDHAETAHNIAAAVGLSDGPPKIINGADLRPVAEMTDAEISALRQADVVARVSPAQKLDLIHAHQKSGEIVAMTGDGVNDAPALKQADIGIAMGKRGTQVAAEAAAMVLRDDAFQSIVSAIREGRVIFRNIQKFVVYLLSCNLSEVLVVGLAILIGLPLPLMPLQILFLNLVTDVFPAFALGAGEGSARILERAPRDPGKPILTRPLWIAIVLHSITIAGATLGAFVLAQVSLGLTVEAALTVSFMTLAFAQLWHVFNMRDPRSGLVLNEVTRNRYVWGAIGLSAGLLLLVLVNPVAAEALDLQMPGADAWLLILGMSLLPLVLGQIAKIFTGRRGGDADQDTAD
jgi:Ca2+-transporting ATPase